MIRLNQIIKSYDSFSLKIDEFTVEDNQSVGIFGKSGSGKSTLMHILGLLDDEYSGEFYLDDEDIKKCRFDKLASIRNNKIGFVFQDFKLIEDETVYNNIILPFEFSKKKVDDNKINELLKMLDIFEKKNSIVNTLSGGEKQRVALIRATILNPKYLLADEPTGNLDDENAKIVKDFLFDYTKNGNSVIIISHNIEIIKECSKIYLIKAGVVSEKK